MPLLDSSNIVNLARDSTFNQGRRLSAGNIMDLSSMDALTRGRTMQKALTPEQQIEAKNSLKIQSELDSKILATIKLPDLKFKPSFAIEPWDVGEDIPTQSPTNRKYKTKKHTAEYDPATKILSIDGQPKYLGRASHQAIVCEIVFQHKRNFTNLVPYDEVILLHEHDFNSVGINRSRGSRQLKTARDQINLKVRKIVEKDFFVGDGGLQLNPIFHIRQR